MARTRPCPAPMPSAALTSRQCRVILALVSTGGSDFQEATARGGGRLRALSVSSRGCAGGVPATQIIPAAGIVPPPELRQGHDLAGTEQMPRLAAAERREHTVDIHGTPGILI